MQSATGISFRPSAFVLAHVPQLSVLCWFPQKQVKKNLLISQKCQLRGLRSIIITAWKTQHWRAILNSWHQITLICLLFLDFYRVYFYKLWMEQLQRHKAVCQNISSNNPNEEVNFSLTFLLSYFSRWLCILTHGLNQVYQNVML